MKKIETKKELYQLFNNYKQVLDHFKDNHTKIKGDISEWYLHTNIAPPHYDYVQNMEHYDDLLQLFDNIRDIINEQTDIIYQLEDAITSRDEELSDKHLALVNLKVLADNRLTKISELQKELTDTQKELLNIKFGCGNTIYKHGWNDAINKCMEVFNNEKKNN